MINGFYTGYVEHPNPSSLPIDPNVTDILQELSTEVTRLREHNNLRQEVDDLNEEVDDLKKELDDLEAQISELLARSAEQEQ
jgi:uncharacterized coiled-coil DUF342 family protein